MKSKSKYTNFRKQHGRSGRLARRTDAAKTADKQVTEYLRDGGE